MESVGKWFYRVKETITAFDGQNNPIGEQEYVKDFKGEDLKKLRLQAVTYFNQQGTDLKEKYGQFFISGSSTVPNDSYSANMYFVQEFEKDDFEENVIAGDDQEENENGMDTEAIVWKEFGFEPPAQIIGLPEEE